MVPLSYSRLNSWLNLIFYGGKHIFKSCVKSPYIYPHLQQMRCNSCYYWSRRAIFAKQNSILSSRRIGYDWFRKRSWLDSFLVSSSANRLPCTFSPCDVEHSTAANSSGRGRTHHQHHSALWDVDNETGRFRGFIISFKIMHFSMAYLLPLLTDHAFHFVATGLNLWLD